MFHLLMYAIFLCVFREDGKEWKPTKHSKVCSVHFVGGKRSHHPLSPSYIPTIMPNEYRKRSTDAKHEQRKRRHERLMKRRQEKDKSCIPVRDNVGLTEPEFSDSPTGDNGSQTCPDMSTKCNSHVVVLFCASDGNNVATQTIIPIAQEDDRERPSPNVKTSTRRNNSPDPQRNGFQGYENVSDNDEMRGLCGVTLASFIFLLTHLSRSKSPMSNENRLLLFLMKMKHGLSFSALGVLFSVHRTTASKHFIEILQELVKKCSNVIYWPSRFAIQRLMPASFANYPNVRAIIDCTEIRCERPPRVDEQVLLYSNYKANFTVKSFVGITPGGFISFLSKCYGGRSTDAYITANCGFLDLLEPGDVVMADKGFPLIEWELNQKAVKLVMPPFATKSQFSKKECEDTYNIASVRIHVERCIARLKTHRILDKVSIEMLPYVDAIVQMCGILVNLQSPIFKG